MNTNATDDDKPDEDNGGTTVETFKQPIIHGSGIAFYHSDTEIYDDTRSLWYDKVGEPGEQAEICKYTPEFADDQYHFFLRSSKSNGGEGEDDDYTPFYKYHIKGRIQKDNGDGYRNPVQSLSLLIRPLKSGMVYPDGREFPLPNGTGTRIEISTTYASTPGEVLRRAQRLLEELYDGYDPSGIEWDTGAIQKLETHYRFDRMHMETAVTGLVNTERLISWMGRSTIDNGRTKRREPGWDIYQFASGAWDRLGFRDLGDYLYALKAYSMPGWWKYDEDSPFYHPKIEAFYSGKKSTESAPHIDDWDELTEVLSHITAMHAHSWIGITEDDLLEDAFFDGSDADPYEYEVLEGRRDDLRNMQEDTKTAIMQEAMKSRSNVPYELLASMIEHEHGVPFKTLRERLGVTQETIRHHAKRMEDAGIAQRVGNPGEVRFKSPVVHETARETMEEMNPGDTAGDQRERRERNLSDESDDSDTNRRQWDYIGSMNRTEVAHAILSGDLSDDEVRVVRDALEAHAASESSETPADDD